MKTITVETNGDTEAIISRAKEAASANGFQFDGDTDSGSFSGMGVTGEYRVNGNIMEISIAEKPAFLPWGMVESQIKSIFA